MIKVFNMDVREGLKQIPSESVNCAITSPPYWALRDYGSSVETIWDSLAESVGVECKHEWTDEIPYAKRDGRTPEQKKIQGATVGNSINSENFAKGNSGRFCLICNAWKGQLGLEPTFDLYIKHLCDIFDEVKRVLIKDGTCWINLGDSYLGGGAKTKEGKLQQRGSKWEGKDNLATLKNNQSVPSKCLAMIPFRFAIEMVNRGWILRNTIIWYKRNCMPSSTTDRFTVDFEYVFFFVKNKKYWFEQQFEELAAVSLNDRRIDKGRFEYLGKRKDVEGIQNIMCGINSQGRNKRCVWDITPKPFKESHFAVFPEELVIPMIKAGCPENGVVLDIFVGSGTTLKVARDLNRNSIGIEINPKYVEIMKKRLFSGCLPLDNKQFEIIARAKQG